jgi:hypothetical protein
MICDEMTPIIRPQISVMHHGFMKGRSTVIDKIENGHQVDGVCTDFSKAFDRVNDGLLCFDLTGVPQDSHLGMLLFINNVDEVFRIF